MCKWKPSARNRIDPCLRDFLGRLNRLNLEVLASCCGHNKYEPTVIFRDRSGIIREFFTYKVIPREKRFYKKDSEGRYFVPEVQEK